MMQPRARAADDHHGQLERHGPAAPAQRGLEDRAGVLAVHVLHRHEVRAVGLVHLVDLRDVLVIERGGELRLVEEHRDEALILSALSQDCLQHHVALERAQAGGAREIDSARSPAGSEVGRLPRSGRCAREYPRQWAPGAPRTQDPACGQVCQLWGPLVRQGPLPRMLPSQPAASRLITPEMRTCVRSRSTAIPCRRAPRPRPPGAPARAARPVRPACVAPTPAQLVRRARRRARSGRRARRAPRPRPRTRIQRGSAPMTEVADARLPSPRTMPPQMSAPAPANAPSMAPTSAGGTASPRARYRSRSPCRPAT